MIVSKVIELCIHNPNLVLEPSTTKKDPLNLFVTTHYSKPRAKGTSDLLTVFIDGFLLEISDTWNPTV